MIEYTVSDGVGVLCFQNPPVNAFSFALLDRLRSILRQANEQAEVQAIVITGGPQHFSAGADLAIFQDIHGDEDAVHASRTFQEIFQEIEDSPKPVVAALAGHVLGGALELAMACHFRVAAERSRFSMPEVRLGINPGAGGTQRLPRLVGVEAALEMLLSGESIDAQRALGLGLIDAIATHDELLACAAEVLRPEALAKPVAPNVSVVPRTSQVAEKVADVKANRAAIAKAQKRAAAAPAGNYCPAEDRRSRPSRFGAIVRGGAVGRARGVPPVHGHPRGAEQDLHLLCQPADRQTGRHRCRSAGPITTAGVLGMGTMGTGIAQALMAAGISVTACDESAAALAAARQKIQTSLERRVRDGKLAAG